MRTNGVIPGVLLGILLLPALPLQAQYAPRSAYMRHPEAAIGYVDSCANFWFTAYDSLYGGFCIGIDQTGRPIAGWGMYKDVVVQSRDAYGFSRAFMLTGDTVYLRYARRALDFMYAHDWDQANGGWYPANDRTGNPAPASAPKAAFDQHYALVGAAALFEATRDTTEWGWLMKGYAANDAHVWDARAGVEGYYDSANAAWSSPWGKSFNATVDAITTHVLALYLLTGDDAYKTRLLALARNIMEDLYPTMAPQKIGFVESYHTDWSWDNLATGNNTRTIMGHVLKTAWCLGRIHQLFPDTAYVAAAESLAANVLRLGYDHELGGPYKDYDRLTGQMMMYGQDTAKAWWQMEQAFTAGMELYAITGEDRYLRMADETIDFFMAYFVDHTYGEVFSDRTRKGGAIPAWGYDKGNSGKGGYHSIEFGYYAYLYGNMFYTHEPATLHYRFLPAASDRVIPMNPIAWKQGMYRIGGVTLNGAPWTDFSAADRTIHLPAGSGGLLAVTYMPATTGVAAARAAAPAEFALGQNYPNPFNPSTTIAYTVTGAGRVTLQVFDLLGKLVATLVDGPLGPGHYTAAWNAAGAPSGVYFYRLTAGGHAATRKALLVR
ncbi:MAG TPA: AGE family epimerase/isomerase [Bacteroidota bacterium]|nr:AGE family epimerase/isomerase [Bacteroidota bacterium]